MRALVLALTVALAGSTTVLVQTGLAQTPESIAEQKLNELRQHRHDLANRHRIAILVMNESNIPNVERHLFDEAARLFSAKGYEIVSADSLAAAVSAHAKGTPWSDAELAGIADRYQVETIAVATLKRYQAKRSFGIPVLPFADSWTTAYIDMDGAVYRRSESKVVWTKTFNHRESKLFGAEYETRSHARSRASDNAIGKMFSEYLTKKS